MVLALSLTLSLVDRMIIALMIEPIKEDLNLTDTQIGLVHGLAFTLTYVIVGLPLGRLADRWNRKSLAAFSVIFWSAMTAACGFANSFRFLFAARMGVGVGEAGLAPAAISMISDYFPKHKRARPLAFLTIGTTAGAGLAMIFGGAVIHAIGTAGDVALPLIGVVHSWQAVFIFLGVFGIAFAAIFLTVREPTRRELTGQDGASVRAVLQYLWRQRSFFLAHFFGAGFIVLVIIAFHSWAPTFFIRRFGWDSTTTGYVYGGCIMLGGLAGVLIAGWLAERMTVRGRRDANLFLPFIGAMLAFAPITLAPLAALPLIVVPLIFIGLVCLTIVPALAPASLQSVCPNEMRGQIFAVYLFVISMSGYAAGPLAVALLTDAVFGDEAMVHYSLALTAAAFIPLAAICLGLARKAHARIDKA